VHPDAVTLLENDFNEWILDRRRRRVDAEASFHGLYVDYCHWASLHRRPLLRPETFAALLTSAASALTTGFPLLEEETPLSDFEEEPLEKGAITAAEWLRDQLAAGPRAAADLRGAATMAGFSWPTIRNAKHVISATSPLAGVWELEATIR